MKDFFSSSVGETNTEEAHAAKTVRTLLKEIINNEKDNKPHSDEMPIVMLSLIISGCWFCLFCCCSMWKFAYYYQHLRHITRRYR